MRRVAHLVMIAGLVLLVPLGSAAAASASEPIHPQQHFVGLVNGSNASPVVYAVCPGPIFAGETGPVAGGQTLAVARTKAGGGYTGPDRQVYAWFVQDSSANGPQQVKFTTYGTEQTIPSTVRVPCGGTGQVEFSSCPDLSPPCPVSAVPDFVAVQFIDIAV